MSVVFLGLVLAVCLMASFGSAAELDVSAVVEKDTVALGESMAVTVTVTNKEKETTEVRELFLGRGSLEFEVKNGDDTFTYTRIVGGAYAPKTPDAVRLQAGKSVAATVKIPALLSGKCTLTPVLWGKVKASPVEVTVNGKGKAVAIKFETSEGEMVAKLLADVAPNTATTIASLVRDGFYDGLIFHRIIKGFMIQGGCPQGSGTGGPGFSVPAEFNSFKHDKGVLSMARSQHPDSAGSQFFLMDGRSPHLDGQYTAYGHLVSGMDTLDKLAATKVGVGSSGEMSKPLKAPLIKKATLITVDAK